MLLKHITLVITLLWLDFQGGSAEDNLSAYNIKHDTAEYVVLSFSAQHHYNNIIHYV